MLSSGPSLKVEYKRLTCVVSSSLDSQQAFFLTDLAALTLSKESDDDRSTMSVEHCIKILLCSVLHHRTSNAIKGSFVFHPFNAGHSNAMDVHNMKERENKGMTRQRNLKIHVSSFSIVTRRRLHGSAGATEP